MIFIIDFDGTLAVHDTVDALLQKFAPSEWEGVEQEWLAGRISAVQCMQQQIRMVEADRLTLEGFFRTIELDPHFEAFRRHASRFAKLAIVSDGLDHAIKVAVQHHGLAGLPIHANRLCFVEGGIDIEFPHRNTACHAGNGVCKCQVANQYAAVAGEPVVLIGDGKSDACLAHRADIVFAKGSLAKYCRANQIAHHEFETFADVLSVIQTWTVDMPPVGVAL